jgi:hypothetical protein
MSILTDAGAAMGAGPGPAAIRRSSSWAWAPAPSRSRVTARPQRHVRAGARARRYTAAATGVTGNLQLNLNQYAGALVGTSICGGLTLRHGSWHPNLTLIMIKGADFKFKLQAPGLDPYPAQQAQHRDSSPSLIGPGPTDRPGGSVVAPTPS